MNTTDSSAQDTADMIAFFALAEAIRTAGEIPSGHLYAQVMGVMSLGTYGACLQTLKGAKLVEERGNLLRWVGPVVP